MVHEIVCKYVNQSKIKKDRNLKKSIKELSLESRPDLRDVFKNFSKNEANTKANDYYLKPPNIFVILSDATYARRLSVYGHSKNTSPVLEKFAKEAVIFKNFYSKDMKNVGRIFDKAKKTIACICSGAQLLISAKVVKGRKM